MNVGIFTFQYGCNYGAILQCLALYRTIKNLGVEVDIINYIAESAREDPLIWRGWGLRKKQTIDHLQKTWIAARHRPAMKRAYNALRDKELTFSPVCSTPPEIAEAVSNYDALITGSDQVWHFAQSSPYFLEWGMPYEGTRISYAPCCGHREQPLEQRDQIKAWLSNFDFISVRNDFSKDLIEPLTGCSVPVVADPTLLTDLSDIQQQVNLPDSEYILTYTLGDQIQEGTATALREVRNRWGDLPVVAVIPSSENPHSAPWADLKIWEAGPAEWLYLIAHAQFVYTDSFHAALFAMRYKKKFLAYYTEIGRAPRLLDLAQRYAVENAVVGSLQEAVQKHFWEPIDFQKTQTLMSEHARTSLDYLRRALGLS